MRLSVLFILGVVCLAVTTRPAEASRTKRTIGSWFSKLWKKWKKEPEPDYDYHRPVYTVIPQPVYHRPPLVKPVYGPPPIRPQPSYHAPPIHVHHGGGPVKGGHGLGGHGIGGHGVGGHGIGGHSIGGHGKGHAVGGHGKGHVKGGHGKGAGGIPHGFGPVKDSDVFHGGHSHHGEPPSVGIVAPSGDYGPPPAESYAPPPPPVVVDSYSAPSVPVISDSYSAPSAPISAPPVAPVVAPAVVPAIAHIPHEPIGPVVPEPSNDYRAPPSFPPPMAAHGSSSSSYLEGSFQPSQPLPVEPALPAPPAPLYNLPVGPDVPRATGGATGVPLPIEVPDGAPAPLEVLPPAPLALESIPEEPRSAGGALALASTGGGIAVGGAPVGLTYGSQLGVDDPIIEIVFQDGDPIPAPPPPIFDPELFALPDEDVEVYFIEYAPGDNLDDLAALSLDGAQPAILHDLPQELPVDIRSQLVGSGILDDAEIQVVDLEDALSQDLLDVDTRNALQAVYGSESRLRETKVLAPEDVAEGGVELRVHRLLNEQGTPKSTAELLTKLQNYREGRFVGVVKPDDNDSVSYLPVIVDGEKIPLPDSLDLEGQKIAEVLVVTNSEDDEDIQEPPANTNNPQHNLVAETSNLRPVFVAAEAIAEDVDRQWHGDPNDWRPVWD